MRARWLFLVGIVAFALGGCGQTQGAEDEEMADRAAQLGHLAVAVDGYVRFGNLPVQLTSDQLLHEATKDNPGLLTPFANHYVAARRQGQLSSVLLCDSSRQRGLAEDAGCTSARLDKALWREGRSVSCVFTLDLPAACGGE